MSIEIVDPKHGILTVRISGRKKHRDLIEAQKAIARILQERGKIRILILTKDFEGWERGDDWSKGNDLAFLKNDQLIEKMAIVGETEWEALSLIFVGKGFRKFPIEYFSLADEAKAREWLGETPDPVETI